MDYKASGVNIEEGYRAVAKYRDLAAAATNRAVLNGIGDFAGLYSLAEFSGLRDPVLVSGTDGVGTKLDVAFRMNKFDTVGIDCVAMCVNDVLCHGARPLFFLDYLACGKLDADIAAQLVKGVVTGCRETNCALLGGETAEMPGFYDEGKYDIAGFCVGIVDRPKLINGSKIKEGDALLGLASSGPHSNGFSLIRKAIPDLNEDFGGMPIGMALLEPTRLYVKPILSLMEKIEILGMAHITGGGFYENIPRMFAPKELSHNGAIYDAVIAGESWIIPPVFERIAQGCLDGMGATDKLSLWPTSGMELAKMMFNTFNMGIGFVIAISPENVQTAREHLDDLGFPAWEIGIVKKAENSAKGELRFANR